MLNPDCVSEVIPRVVLVGIYVPCSDAGFISVFNSSITLLPSTANLIKLKSLSTQKTFCYFNVLFEQLIAK